MIKTINDIDDPALNIFCRLTEAELRRSIENDLGIFIAESPKVITVALDHGYQPIALLCEEKHIHGDASDIVDRIGEVPVYIASRNILHDLTGYRLTRGVLCAMKRPELPTLDHICKNSHLLCIMHGICDTTNVGSIFRSAAALGVDGIILSGNSCDPLNRRVVRVSMGTVFTVPWTVIRDPVKEIHNHGFDIAALALRKDNLSLQDDKLKHIDRLAVIFGTEGDGLPNSVIDECDYVIKIPMAYGIDSLNVGAAAAVTFWELMKKS